jgi:hypothetical protein
MPLWNLLFKVYNVYPINLITFTKIKLTDSKAVCLRKDTLQKKEKTTKFKNARRMQLSHLPRAVMVA